MFEAEDGIRDLVRSRGLGDVYKRQLLRNRGQTPLEIVVVDNGSTDDTLSYLQELVHNGCLLYTSDAADERSSVDLGGRRIIKKKTKHNTLKDIPQE